MQGERPLAEIGRRALEVIAGALGAPVAAVYATEGPGADADRDARPAWEDVPRSFTPGHGLVGEAVRDGQAA